MKEGKELYKKIEHRDIKSRAQFLGLPDEDVCKTPARGKKDNWDREVLCPTRHKSHRGRKKT
jgi:hypothetical protein